MLALLAVIAGLTPRASADVALHGFIHHRH